jgi:hypothetical protein
MRATKETLDANHVSLHFTCDQFFEDMKSDKNSKKKSLFTKEARTLYSVQDQDTLSPTTNKKNSIDYIIEEMSEVDTIKVDATRKRKKSRKHYQRIDGLGKSGGAQVQS